MLRQLLLRCRERGLEKVMLTCNRDNIAGYKTILRNGGVFEKDIVTDGEYISRYRITL